MASVRPALLVCVSLSLTWTLTRCDPTPANSTLEMVQVVFRHGDRTPVITCPTDPNTDTWLHRGLGQLTNVGKVQQYQLGQFLRERYKDFLHNEYHVNFTEVTAANFDRTLMSAQTNLAGLYPPKGDDIWNPALLWQPIPVHTRPQLEDIVFEFLESCAMYRKDLEALLDTPKYHKLDTDNAPLYEFITDKCGTHIGDFRDLLHVYDLLSIEQRNSMPVPKWAFQVLKPYNKTVFPDLLAPLSDIAFQMLSGTEVMRRLGGGQLLRLLLDNLDSRIHNSSDQRQLHMYSGHDSDVAALLGTLGVFNGLAPPLASSVLLELYREPAGGHFVQLFYRNSTVGEPHQLRLPNCTAVCPWEAFRDIAAKLVPKDPVKECADTTPGLPNMHQVEVIVLATMLALLLTLCTIGAVMFCRQRRQRALSYSHFTEVEG